MKRKKICVALVFFWLLPVWSLCQPFIDLGKVSYAYTPEKGLNKKVHPLYSHNYSFDITLPIELKKDGDAFIINPFYDHANGNVSATDFHLNSQGVLLGFLKKDIFKNWSLLSGFILRQNKETGNDLSDDWQYGGIILTTWKKAPSISFKFGLYYNKEFFGNYFIPLVGIDWRINPKNNLFGVLPGNLAFEHKVNGRFYYGFSFRALTNSYRVQAIDPCFSGDCSAKHYLRIDDNQLGIFSDTYISKRIVFTTEAGYTIFRRYRYGFKGDVLDTKTDLKSDNFYIRGGLAYRLRFH